MHLHFEKYQGAGNDFVMVDDRNRRFPRRDEALVARLCDRHFGIGADGLILLQEETEGEGLRMIYYNADGREGSFCGNGSRCFAQFAFMMGLADDDGKLEFTAADGLHVAEVKSDAIRVKMSDTPLPQGHELGLFLNTGSPHLVVWGGAFPDDVKQKGRQIRHSPPYANEGVNVNFAVQESGLRLKLRTYERGVEDETLACGTGITASAMTHPEVDEGFNLIEVQALGGTLYVEFRKTPHGFENVWLTGPAERVFGGSIEL